MRSSTEVFDRARFLASVDGNMGVVREIAQLFAEDCPRRLAALRGALDGHDFPGLESAAHLLKGSAGYIGASNMFAAAIRLERFARNGDLARARIACARLEKETVRLVQALAAIREGPSRSGQS